ncbi:cytochrome aa3 quinol oxidase subunit III [Falsibacillus pallidus]|uniref:cytochrome aa3 quinol oxidase subunit III n=1 Tax=Falsibacillus pallidus TaxID=493781 RepID=UPI003D989320
MDMVQNHDQNTPMEYQSETGRLNILGFWVFLGAEIALFSTLFATYFALMNRTANGPLPGELFELKGVLIETFLLLTSSFTCGIAVHEMRRNNKKGLMAWMIITVLLGLGFIGFEISEFISYVHEGATLSSSAFWSALFVLVGTHGAHVSLGIGWVTLVLIQTSRRGLNPATAKKVFITSLYWHFLDVVWIFIFTGVYLTGMVMHHG